MPTPGGLPKVGETWTYRDQPFTVLARTRGSYWALEVRWHDPRTRRVRDEWLVDAPWYLERGDLRPEEQR